MPSFIHNLDISYGIQDIQLPQGYTSVMLLIKYSGKPLGSLNIQANSRIIPKNYILHKIADNFSSEILKQCLLDALPYHSISKTKKSTLTIDVVVCTCDRPDDLRRCIHSLNLTDYPHKSIIIVDNGRNTDNTRQVADEFDAIYVREEKQGLDFARNAGIRASKADIVAFADDDVVVDPQWLDAIIDTFNEDTGIACVTGLTMPLELDTPAQELFEKYSDGGMKRGYERKYFNRIDLTPSAAGKVGAGANMAFRKTVLEKIGLFDEALDCGTPTKAGGDADMFYRILRNGYKICYEPKALSWHRHRRTMEELRSQLGGYSKAVYATLTKWFLEYGDNKVLSTGYSWFKGHHVKNLLKGMIGKGSQPWNISVAEFVGVFEGPAAYFRSRAYTSAIRNNAGTEYRKQLIRGTKQHSSGILVYIASSICNIINRRDSR